uniref:Uncharacterized protein n=1 Tax=Anguilla anguilla TaxID=7936 RepID=A0A0E9Q548_ANGAN
MMRLIQYCWLCSGRVSVSWLR